MEFYLQWSKIDESPNCYPPLCFAGWFYLFGNYCREIGLCLIVSNNLVLYSMVTEWRMCSLRGVLNVGVAIVADLWFMFPIREWLGCLLNVQPIWSLLQRIHGRKSEPAKQSALVSGSHWEGSTLRVLAFPRCWLCHWPDSSLFQVSSSRDDWALKCSVFSQHCISLAH